MEGKGLSGIIRKIIISEQYVNNTTKRHRKTEIGKKPTCLLQHKGEESQGERNSFLKLKAWRQLLPGNMAEAPTST